MDLGELALARLRLRGLGLFLHLVLVAVGGVVIQDDHEIFKHLTDVRLVLRGADRQQRSIVDGRSERKLQPGEKTKTKLWTREKQKCIGGPPKGGQGKLEKGGGVNFSPESEFSPPALKIATLIQALQ